MTKEKFYIFSKTSQPNGIGGTIETETFAFMVNDGLLDMLTGTDFKGNIIQNAYIEASTHVLILPYRTDLKEGQGVGTDENKPGYRIVFVDDPGNQHHHLEVYLNKVV